MGKCKFWKKCKLYDKESVTCNKNKGGYYPDGIGLRIAGCYIQMNKKEKQKGKLMDNIVWQYFLGFSILLIGMILIIYASDIIMVLFGVMV